MDAITECAGHKFSPEIVIGDNVSISFWGHIAAINRVEIGSGVLIGSNVHITDHSHGSYGPETHSSPTVPPAERPLSPGTVVIGKNVWLGDGVFVGPNSEIGESCIIGTNSVVKGAIPPFTIAVGAPARPVKVFDFERQEWVRIEDQR